MPGRGGEHVGRRAAGRRRPACTASDGSDVKHFLNLACFAERCVGRRRAAIVPVPDDLPLWQAALVGCSVMTGVGAVRNAAGVEVGETVAVIGCGGVGAAGRRPRQRLAGAVQVIAVDLDPAKLELARSHGATDVVQASDRARCTTSAR